MTDELISKTDVVKIVKSVLSPASSLTNVARARRQMLNEINELESKPEPHWIPVTERLPEKSGRYFVTERIYHINDKEHTGGFILKTDFAEYSATEKKWRRTQALVVVAWMDNEPYKGVTE